MGPRAGEDGVVKRKSTVISDVFTTVRLKTELLGCDTVHLRKFGTNVSEEPAASIFRVEWYYSKVRH